MIRLLKKEFALALHPTSILFWGLSAMLLIPNYPYYVTFFYTTLGLFFVCLTARENHDIEYSLLLPVRKRDLVRARIGMAVVLEGVQALVAVPFAILRQRLIPVGNSVGMDANIAFFGLAFGMMGLFNFVFFTRYFARPDRVGRHFALGATVVFVYMAAAETLAHAVPFFRDRLDTPDPAYLPEKLAVLAVGLCAFALLTVSASRVSERRFEALDL